MLLGADTQAVDGRSGEGVRLRVWTPAGERARAGSDLLVATGRAPNTRGVGLDAAGVALDVRVDERLSTSAPGVRATGECAGSPQFTHVASDDFRVVRDTLAGGADDARPGGPLLPVHRPSAGAAA